MKLSDIQREIDEWMSQFEAGYWPPLANLARLVEEVGELSREINHAHGPKTKKATESAGSIEEELGDIVFSVATIANSLGLDLETCCRKSLDKVAKRDANRWKRTSPDSDGITPRAVSGLDSDPDTR